MSEKKVYTIVRIIIGAIFTVVLLNMFVLAPKNSDSHSLNQDNLWEAVHPWDILPDTIALVGWIVFALYLCGFLGKVYDLIQPEENSSGLIHVIGVTGMLVGLLFFI